MTVATLPRTEREELAILLAEKDRRESRRKLFTYYPEIGKLSRNNYPKHMAFFAAGALHRERAAMAANRVGKTEGMGGFELVLHLTGLYPSWWRGKRFDGPIEAWAVGTTRQTTRDILQAKLLGDPGVPSKQGTGLIPGDLIIDMNAKPGVPDAVETVQVRHRSGGISLLTFKSYDQGRKAFEGTAKHVVLLDEEPDEGIYSECLIRTMATGGFKGGIVMLTFTPLNGLSTVVLMFMPGGKVPDGGVVDNRFMVSATWDDAPHLSDDEKRNLLSGIPPHQRDARSKGIPQLGSGAIFPISEDKIAVADFSIPDHWPKLMALDVGWNMTAAIWGAWDRESDTVYLYSAYGQGHAEPPVHAAAVKSRGEWIPGKIDPAARGRSQKDGEKLMDLYLELGLNLSAAENAVDAGLLRVWNRMITGRLKVFKSLMPWFEEFRIYRRDENGKVIKQKDHFMDCTRYLIASIHEAIVKPMRGSGMDESYISVGPGGVW